MFRTAFISLTTLMVMTELAQAVTLNTATTEIDEWQSLPAEFAQITDEPSDIYGLLS